MCRYYALKMCIKHVNNALTTPHMMCKVPVCRESRNIVPKLGMRPAQWREELQKYTEMLYQCPYLKFISVIKFRFTILKSEVARY